MKNKRIYLTAAFSLFLANASFATGIPVFDASTFAQAVLTVQKMQTQIQNQLQQYQQMQQQYQALTGSRNLGDILNNPALRQYLPANWQSTYDQIKNGNLSPAAQAILNAEKLAGGLSGAQRYLNSLATNKAMSLQAFQQTQNELNNLQSLMRQINQTQDPKAAADLQNRIAAEQAIIQNQQAQLGLASQLQQAELELAKQQNLQDFRNRYLLPAR